ncbi:MAG: ROK family protein [Ignavibacteriae bacterium]|nr:ROK family protein [Ignavibacteriota bacterium]
MSTQHYFLGIDLGATTVKTGCVSSDGKILSETKVSTEAHLGPDAVVQQIMKTVDSMFNQYGNDSLEAIGIGAPGIVNNGIVKAPPNISAWDEVNLQNEINRITGIKVVVENDANCAALAEAKFGAGIHHRNFLFVIWGTGVGGGIILDGKIYHGPNGGAGEIGHTTIDFNGPDCNCGNKGCIEAYIGQRYLSQRTKELLQKSNVHSKIIELVEGDFNKIEPAVISLAAEQGDAVAKEILTEAGTLLGYALSNVSNILDLETVIIGGGISAAPQFVYDAVTNALRARVLKPHRPNIQVLRAKLGNTAGIIGAASLVI